MKNLLVGLGLLICSWASAQHYKTHRVEGDETIEQIADQHHVSKAAIYKLNPDAKNNLREGTVLVIPFGETPDGVSGSNVLRFKVYEVPPKGTLYSIAKDNHITVEDIKRFNPRLYQEELQQGEQIKIPIFTKKSTVDLNESVQKSTFKNLKHIVLPKEGKFTVAKKYGMTVEELEAINPNMGVLQPGQVLNVINPNATDEEDEIDTDKFLVYEVPPKQTFYSLTREFNISKEELERLNPQLKKEGLEKGMTLRIPKPDYATSAKDSIAAWADKGKLNLAANIKHRNTKRIAVMLPFNLDEFKRDSINKVNQLKKDRILRISLDFYSGVIAAIDSVERMGIAVDASIFDTQQNKNHLQNLFNQRNFNHYQAVIGPVLTENVEWVSKQLENDDIPVLSPLTGAELKGGKNLFQTRPASIMMERSLFSYIDSLKQGKNIVIITDKKHQYLRDKLTMLFPTAKVVSQAKQEYLQRSDVSRLLSKDQPNWIIMEADEMATVTNVTSFLYNLADTYEIRLFTSSKSDPYEEEVSNEYLSKLHFTYASIAREFDSEENPFVKQYQEKYGIVPSKYAVRGFDLTLDLLLRLAAEESLLKSVKQKGYTEYVENRFDYHQSMMGGYYNDAVYIIEYIEDLQLKILN